LGFSVVDQMYKFGAIDIIFIDSILKKNIINNNNKRIQTWLRIQEHGKEENEQTKTKPMLILWRVEFKLCDMCWNYHWKHVNWICVSEFYIHMALVGLNFPCKVFFFQNPLHLQSVHVRSFGFAMVSECNKATTLWAFQGPMFLATHFTCN
jgi:hypothetical protein